MWVTLDRSITGLAKSLGYGGAGFATMYSIVREFQNQKELGKKDPARILQQLLSAAPALSAKAGDLITAAKKLQKKSPDYIKGGSAAVEFATGLPALKVLKLVDDLKNWSEQEEKSYKDIMRLMGWSEWDFKSFGKSKSGLNLDLDFGNLDLELDLSPLNRLARGEAGQAHNDGTIEIDPNLSPIEREKTIKHEKQHVKDMKENGLDYDDDNVYWKGAKHARKNGKIEYNGKMLPEGDPSLPWEQRAYEAEGSPLKQTGHEHDEDRRKKEAELRKQSREYAQKYGFEDKSIQDLSLIHI